MIVSNRDKIVQAIVCLIAFVVGCAVLNSRQASGQSFVVALFIAATCAVAAGCLFTLIADYVRFVIWREK